ncbi:DUF1345 domain-containing protein [Amycolatopsis sp. K13G38]|uniref:DUF1345 domain-containing protein n=1 Tax=Amycolatopsis acididurans TaxID=2724524 RepID=A0ABX1JG70_9PSEU|nr:DUF1345 domain-containing protein [Amycolatopsis acididurans]NKQ58196.1 DUF1345 domain-containing protein [Amycolatopsis acididurans]
MHADETPVPAWRGPTPGEHRWPAVAVVVGTVALQVLLPDELVLRPWWLLPAVTALLVVALMLINPGRVSRRTPVDRTVALGVVAVVSVANGASAVGLVSGIIDGSITNRPGSVLLSAAIVYWTNIVVFSLWYWEFDRGGPGQRASGGAEYPDLMFPQMSNPELAPKDWEPTYPDYLYLSFTNATAFSPTDVMPLRRWAKLTMMLQSAISLMIALLVVAWAVGALKP